MFGRSFKRVCSGKTSSKGEFFGFQHVEKGVRQVKVSNYYDLMNDSMSFGMHRVWKNYFVNLLDPHPNEKFLDLAGGTGDISFRILDKVSQQIYNGGQYSLQNLTIPEDIVTVADISPNMLEYGKERANKLGLHGLNWVVEDGSKLSFADCTFDAVTISFGLRNITNTEKALSEIIRVLKPSGRFFCLEFSHIQNPLLSKLYEFYSFEIIPVIGQVVAQDWRSYKYLVESINMFHNQNQLVKLMEKTGFSNCKYENIFNGLVAIHSGCKNSK